MEGLATISPWLRSVDSGASAESTLGEIIPLLMIILLVLLLAGGGYYGYSDYGAGGGTGIRRRLSDHRPDRLPIRMGANSKCLTVVIRAGGWPGRRSGATRTTSCGLPSPSFKMSPSYHGNFRNSWLRVRFAMSTMRVCRLQKRSLIESQPLWPQVLGQVSGFRLAKLRHGLD
jgi:hypothetical protein